MSALQAPLAAMLTAALGSEVRVVAYPATVDGVTGPTVAVWASDLVSAKVAPKGFYEVEFTLALYVAYQDPQRAEDGLAVLLEAVLDALWDSDPYLLTRASRTVSEDNRIHSWTLTVSGGITITEDD